METELEKILANSYRREMESYVAAHPESFEEAVKLAIAQLARMPPARRYFPIRLSAKNK